MKGCSPESFPSILALVIRTYLASHLLSPLQAEETVGQRTALSPEQSKSLKPVAPTSSPMHA